jgi:NAD(P)-dependent dehydrogenase (short-subunit alcohol dehydrogenase family)
LRTTHAAVKSAIVVTGASSGIGQACALRLDRAQRQVFAAVRKTTDADALRRRASGRLTPIVLDVTDEKSIASAEAVVSRAVGDAGIAGLVNNAGVGVLGPLEFIPLDEFRSQLEVNVVGQVAVTRAFLRLLRLGRGRIVNIGSAGGRVAIPFFGAYSASKFAFEAVTDALRVELRPWGISVAIVEVGGVATPIWRKSRAALAAAQTDWAGHDRMQALYGDSIAGVLSAIDDAERIAIQAERVARAVERALTLARPKVRYLVGVEARAYGLLARFTPARFRDFIFVRRLRLCDRSSDQT